MWAPEAPPELPVLPPRWLARERARIAAGIGPGPAGDVLRAALDAVARAAARGRLAPADRARLLAGIAHPGEPVYGRAVGYALRLGRALPAALDLVRAAARSSDATTRYNVCAAVADRRFPRALARELLPAFAVDRSKLVCKKAADATLARGFRFMLPLLDAIVADQTKRPIWRSVEQSLALLRHGVHVDDLGRTTYRHPDGTITTRPPRRARPRRARRGTSAPRGR